ncbi:MAG: hypothetical protein IJZ53_11225 [Tyzzerella sp.]|nr:hypothetical protein [Tyzzerella sp.]
MADIIDVIRRKYDIDIKKDNIIKLYKIDSADISISDLESKIVDRRKKWNQSINGANEKFAERDKAYLEKADKFEAILRDEKLRKDLFEFYKGKKGSGSAEVSGLVKKYFGLISATTKVGKSELEFFLKYFPDEKKNKKSILEFLKKEYKVVIASFGGQKDNEEEMDEDSQKTKKKSSSFIVNLFSEKTLIKLRKCELDFNIAAESEQVVSRYPEVKKSLYEYLEIGKYKKLDDFKKHVGDKRTEIYNIRNDFGSEFISLVDLYNGLSSVVENDDVRDNFEEFKLLIMYPALTPYMYEIGEIKKDTLNELYAIANEEYSFRSVTDFLVSYFNIVYDNFGIYEDPIKKIMANAEKQAGKEKVLNAISSLWGRTKGRKLPAKLRVVYALSYWPIHVLAFVFKAGKFAIEKLRYFGVGSAVLISLMFIFGGESVYGDANLFTNGLPWGQYLKALNGLESTNFLLQLLSSIEAIIKIIFMYFSIGGVVGYFFWQLSVNLRKKIDLKGLERSIDAIIDNAKKRIIEQDEDNPNGLMSKKMPLIITNVVGLLVFVMAVILLNIIL